MVESSGFRVPIRERVSEEETASPEARSDSEEPCDYYKLLDVARSSSVEEIRGAYKRLALAWHPDKNQDPDAERRFKQISTAYDVLKDGENRNCNAVHSYRLNDVENQRRLYDQFGPSLAPTTSSGAHMDSFFFSEQYHTMFDEFFWPRNFRRGR